MAIASLHVGTVMEVLYDLQAFGISVENLAVDASGNLHVDRHLKYLEQCRQQEPPPPIVTPSTTTSQSPVLDSSNITTGGDSVNSGSSSACHGGGSNNDSNAAVTTSPRPTDGKCINTT